jgi:hypothetical protein
MRSWLGQRGAVIVRQWRQPQGGVVVRAEGEETQES